MPGGDRTGPQGAGPMTGRGAGMCAGYEMPGYMNSASGRGFGGGRRRGFGSGFQGAGRGWRHQYYATGLPGWARDTGAAFQRANVARSDAVTPMHAQGDRTEELAALKEQTQYFKRAIEELEGRVSELQRGAGSASETERDKD